ncbi:hypothetical protein HRI_004424600 [Hibiscus trionum]|uniref:Fatty acyl-CoA reductase n=1 Tax=Hibiscus trionum TaxID=183268 RepID=A0A9W7MME9_HIBTR|nr:hypothetical protein HRI_004424600 [Hibiscus trionum]
MSPISASFPVALSDPVLYQAGKGVLQALYTLSSFAPPSSPALTKSPFPDWVEGTRTIDSLAVAYAKGILTFFLGNLDPIVDVIPADMVVNAMIAAMMAHTSHQPPESIYQVGSSLRNPIKYFHLQDYAFRYFTNKPWINKDEKSVIVGRVQVLDNMDSCHRYMAFRYLLLLKVLPQTHSSVLFCFVFNLLSMEFH